TTGMYKPVIDPVNPTTGSATFTFYDIPSDVTGNVSLSSPAPSSATGSVSVTVPGQNGLVSFAGTVGMRVAVSITSTTLTSGTISILRPGGSVLKTGGLSKGAFLDVATLDANGTHQIEFDPSDSGTGTVTFGVHHLPRGRRLAAADRDHAAAVADRRLRLGGDHDARPGRLVLVRRHRRPADRLQDRGHVHQVRRPRHHRSVRPAAR